MQARDAGDLELGSSRGGGKRLDSGYRVNVEPEGFPGQLGVR